ncbi:MAG: trigger factor [Thermosulfidibacteraceae bacterium]
MKVEVKEIEPLRLEVSVEIPQDLVDSTFDEIYRKLQKETKVPGFRPGKAPKNIIKARFGEYAKIEAIETIFRENYPKIIEEVKAKPIKEPDIKELDFDEGKPLKFKLLMEVHPEFELKDYENIEIEVKKYIITDEFVDSYIEKLRENFAEYREKAGVVSEGDMVIFEYEAFEGERPLQEKKIEGVTHVAGSSRDVQDGPNHFLLQQLDSALMGKGVGEEFTFQATYPENFPDKNLAGKTITFKGKIISIKERILPELDEKFFEKFNVTNLEALKEKVRTELEMEYKRLAKREAMGKIVEKLVEMHNFPVPPTIFESVFQEKLKNYEMDLRLRGIEPKEEDLKKVKEELKKEAINEVKAEYIISKIAEKEGIEVTRDEIERNVELMARSVNTTIEKMAEFLRSTGKLAKIIENIGFSKTLEALLEKIKTKEVEVELKPKTKGEE